MTHGKALPLGRLIQGVVWVAACWTRYFGVKNYNSLEKINWFPVTEVEVEFSSEHKQKEKGFGCEKGTGCNTAPYGLLSPTDTQGDLLDPNSVVLLSIHEPVHRLKFSYSLPCHRLDMLDHLSTNTCLGELRTTRHSFCGHAQNMTQPIKLVHIQCLF